jgi:hypothetical protein
MFMINILLLYARYKPYPILTLLVIIFYDPIYAEIMNGFLLAV